MFTCRDGALLQPRAQARAGVVDVKSRARVRAPARAVALALMPLLALVPATGKAEPTPTPTSTDGEPARPAAHGVGLTAGLGIRSDLVHSGGLDPFSVKDGVPQSALSISYRWGDTTLPSMAVGFEWDHGVLTGTARGAETTLTIDRLSLGLEGRLPLATRLVAFGRVAPGLLRDQASLLDASAPGGAYGGAASGNLQQTTWVAAGDLSGGLAYRFTEFHGGAQGASVFGFWLTAEGGYGYAAAHDLVLSPHVETQPGRTDEPLRLGQLAFRGAFLRIRLALSF
jgi:hypothetical protein